MGKKRTSKKQWLWEFSKRLVVAVTFVYVAAIVYTAGFMLMYPDSTAIVAFIEDISKVFLATVVSYAVKSAFENVTKIKNNPEIQEGYTGRGNDYGSDDV